MWPFSGETPLVTSAWPRPWAPVPQSSSTSVPPDDRSSTHEVFPPYRTVLGPGLAIEPRVPQKRTSMKRGFRLTLRAEPVYTSRLVGRKELTAQLQSRGTALLAPAAQAKPKSVAPTFMYVARPFGELTDQMNAQLTNRP